MEGNSSESAWQKSADSSRALNSTSGVSDRDPTSLFPAERIDISGEVLHDFGLRKEDDDHLRSQQPVGLSGVCENEAAVNNPFVQAIEWGDISLRQWLDNPERSVDVFECLHIFRQIVEIVNTAHSQGIVVHNVRPSCFIMSSFNHVSFIESASSSDSGSDSVEDGLNSQNVEVKDLSSTLPLDMRQQWKLMNEDEQQTPTNGLSEASCMQSGSVCARNAVLDEESEENKGLGSRNFEQVGERKQPFPMKQILVMETSWYSSPEEVAGSPSTCASDIYRLGVLLFELFCPFSSREEKTRTMSSLRHRVLPPQLLLKWPKEASFCLWLLHPEPSSRPKMGELLQSEFLNEPRDNLEEREAAIELRERLEEQELLLEFLLLIQQRKQEVADRLQDTVSFLCSDIDEVTKQQTILKKKGSSYTELGKDDDNSKSNLPSINIVDTDDSSSLGSRKRCRPGLKVQNVEECADNLDTRQMSDTNTKNQESILLKSSRLMKNFKKLESAYFSTRCRPVKQSGKPLSRQTPLNSDGRGSIVLTERSSVNNLTSKERYSKNMESGWINPFLEGLCKYLSYSKLKVKADLNQGDLLNSSNLVCSLGFDRDAEFFATAGVSKKIKVFECDAIINENRDIHYPVVEMASRSKISSICWNSYIKSQIASSNFEGVVQVWDVTRSQVLTEMKEHEKRVWSIDFSSADPTILASGSDDGSVKLWSINQGASVCTIKTKANVCCVQFPMDSARSLAFGSADHKIYYYDLRNSRIPLCTLVGHDKTVSYVKFVDTNTLVSASTDNTLKLWDLSMCNSRVIDTPLQSFTGHMNVKNFVGLSVSDGYIATGSETNEVFIYHKAFPMPALTFKFNDIDPLSGHEMADTSQFISSVCWRGQSSTLVAANSTGNIKIMEMV